MNKLGLKLQPKPYMNVPKSGESLPKTVRVPQGGTNAILQSS